MMDRVQVLSRSVARAISHEVPVGLLLRADKIIE
jgi:hypothetical protein